jgi:hypothetical protein
MKGICTLRMPHGIMAVTPEGTSYMTVPVVSIEELLGQELAMDPESQTA